MGFHERETFDTRGQVYFEVFMLRNNNLQKQTNDFGILKQVMIMCSNKRVICLNHKNLLQKPGVRLNFQNIVFSIQKPQISKGINSVGRFRRKIKSNDTESYSMKKLKSCASVSRGYGWLPDQF